MAGVVPRFEKGPITCTVAETVRGGQLVEARAGGVVGVAGAGSATVLGVATKDAAPPGTRQGTDEFGHLTYTEVAITEYVAVGGAGAVYPVTYAAAANFGDRLVAAAEGQVTPAGATPDARTIVGVCWEPNGVTAGSVGLARIYG